MVPSSTPEPTADTILVEALKLSGDAAFHGEVPMNTTVGGLLGQMKLDCEGSTQHSIRRYRLQHNDAILEDHVILKDVLSPPCASLVLITEEFFKVPAASINGVHTNNPAYFTYVDQGSEECYLRLEKVCWFEVGGTFKDIPAGSYRVLIEAARADRLDLDRKVFDVTVGAVNVQWDASAVLTSDFQEFEVAQLDHDATGDITVTLNMRANWVSGFCWKAIFLK